MPRLTRSFFTRPTVDTARDLLGCVLVHQTAEGRISGRIVETEAYSGFDDQASHGYRGKTERNAAMFGTPGISYVYFIYGIYWMFNVIARPAGVEYPGAILIRALEPLEGLDIMAANRAGRRPLEWTNGPAKLTLAMDIDKRHDGLDLTGADSALYFEAGALRPGETIQSGPRVGLGRAVGEPWLSKPWRFYLKDHRYVSG